MRGQKDLKSMENEVNWSKIKGKFIQNTSNR